MQASSTIRMSVLVLLVRRTLSRDQSCAGFQNKSKNRRYVFVTVRTQRRNARQNSTKCSGKRPNDIVLEFLENPTSAFFAIDLG